MGRLGDRHPLVLIIDDLHWGDQDSASLVVDLLEPPIPPALLLLLRERIPAAHFSHAPWERWDQAATGYGSASCPSTSCRQTMHWRWPETLRRDFADSERETLVTAAARESGGNPFFIGELVRHARHDPTRFDDLSGGRPIRLVDVVEERLRSLSPEARRCWRSSRFSAVRSEPPRPAGAAGVLENGPSMLGTLRASRLIRTTNLQGTQDRYETYHDRIRETLLSLL